MITVIRTNVAPFMMLVAFAWLVLVTAGCTTTEHESGDDLSLERARRDKPRNIIFILCDDHRADSLGFAGHPWLKTPHLDRMAKGGAYCPNAFVTTSLCSPSRASILTGLYAHNHGVSDNYHPVNKELVFFPQYLQKAGYETAFIGKWHMGDEDTPQRGFDHWAAFKGQGTYWPDGHGTTRVVPQTRYDGYNVNGKRVPQKGYITDELTDMSLDWINNRKSNKPYCIYISHKAVHSDFVPHDRHRGRYENKPWKLPASHARRDDDDGVPMWVKNQRNSRHGADYGYNLSDFGLEVYYKRYHEALLAIDDSVGRVLDFLKERGELESTLVVYMGDNGFLFGEHGLIDKRNAYEESIRVPLLVHCPELIKPESVMKRVVANIDIAPTLLDVAGLKTPKAMDGASFLPLLQGNELPEWRDALLYEYYWEWNYPHTPTVHAIRTGDFKYIRYHGVWDTDELFDMRKDPQEMNNLIRDPKHVETTAALKKRMFQMLAKSNGDSMKLLPDRGRQFYNRHSDHASQGRFPSWYFEKMKPVTN